jgi:hypothetical protein
MLDTIGNHYGPQDQREQLNADILQQVRNAVQDELAGAPESFGLDDLERIEESVMSHSQVVVAALGIAEMQSVRALPALIAIARADAVRLIGEANVNLDQLLSISETEAEELPTEEEANSALDDRLTAQNSEPGPDFQKIAETSNTHAEELNRLIALVKRGDQEAVDRLAYAVFDDDKLSQFDGSAAAVTKLLRSAARIAENPISRIPKKMFSEHYRKTGHPLGAVKGEIDAVLDSLNIPHDGPVEGFDHDLPA